MKKKEINNNIIRVNKILFIFIFFLFVLFILRLSYLCLIDYKVENITISEFITNRNVKEEIVMPKRGSIYDSTGNYLAQDVASYTVIAYLKSTTRNCNSTLETVSNIDMTSESLSSHLNMTTEAIKELLSKDACQVELGPGGRNLSQLEMEAIKDLKLSGIDFVKSTKRYYPNGDFASYLIGYTINKEDSNKSNWMTGELGIEEYYNDILKGQTGFITYERDRYGYKISNGREYIEEAKNGDDIYLTIDNNIQLFVENAIKKVGSESEAEWSFMVVMDAKTGAILGYSSTPSFDPNERNMTSYIDPLTGYAYEPGSTMKVFSFMCAIETGNYNGEATYTSGSKTYTSEINNDEVTINDWNRKGWGTITYDQGFALSSNIAVANLVETVLNKNTLSACYNLYGFGKSTGFSLKREESGSIDFNYQVEVATAGYGQGITITPIQYIQALTALANDGNMVRPYVVSKIIDGTTKEINYEGTTTIVDNIISSSTITKMKELMRSVINPDYTKATGSAYYMEGYDLIGKTGTAQIYDYESGRYLQGWTDYIYSFAGLYPGNDPDIIIYTAMQKPKDSSNYLAPAVKSVVENTSKYLNIETKEKIDNTYILNMYINKNTDEIKNTLEQAGLNVIILGNGSKIIKQYPSSNNILTRGDLVVLLTNNYSKEMINLSGLSYKEVSNILKLMNVEYTLEGKGYVYYQSLEAGSIINEPLIIKLR